MNEKKLFSLIPNIDKQIYIGCHEFINSNVTSIRYNVTIMCFFKINIYAIIVTLCLINAF